MVKRWIYFAALIVIAAWMLMWVIAPLAAQDATQEPNPANTPPGTLSSAEAESVLNESRLSSMRTDLALDSIDKILAIIQVVGVVGAIATAVIAVAGWRTSREFNEEMERMRVLETNLQQALNEVSSARDLLSRIEIAQEEIHRLRDEVGASLAEVRLSRDELDANLNQVNRQITDAYKASGLAQLGQRQIALGNIKAASGVFAEICELDPGNPIYRYFLGDLLIRQGRVDEGIEHLRHARQDSYKYPSADASYAYALRLRGDEEPDTIQRERLYAESGQIFLGVFQIDPDLVDISGESVFGALAGLYRRQGRYEDALRWYEHCRKVSPGNSYPINNLAVLHFRLGHASESRTYFELVQRMALERLSARSSDYWSRFDLITARAGLGEPLERILPDLNQAFESVPGPGPLKKFLYGLNDLQQAQNPPPEVVRVIGELTEHVKTEIARREVNLS